jgi:hypothetical protein
MPIEKVETPKTNEEELQQNKPLLNIKLPAPISGDPNEPLSISRHNATAQYNFQEVGRVLLAIINNQKVMGLIVQQISDDQSKTNESIKEILENLKTLLGNTEEDINVLLENKEKKTNKKIKE